MKYVFGIGDSSSNDGYPNWDMAALMGVQVALTRAASTGAWVGGKPSLTRDTSLMHNAEGMYRNGIKRATYAWFDPRTKLVPAEAQAENYLEAIRDIGPGEIGPVLDLEATAVIRPSAGVGADILKWLRIVERETGIRPRIYTNADFVQTALWNTSVQETWLPCYEIIVAHWGASAPRVPAPWHPLSWRGWQYANNWIGKPYGFGRRPICPMIWRADDDGTTD